MKFGAKRSTLLLRLLSYYLLFVGVVYFIAAIVNIFTSGRESWLIILIVLYLSMLYIYIGYLLLCKCKATPKYAFIIDEPNGTIYFPKENQYVKFSDVTYVKAIPRVNYLYRIPKDFRDGRIVICTRYKEYSFGGIDHCKEIASCIESLAKKDKER